MSKTIVKKPLASNPRIGSMPSFFRNKLDINPKLQKTLTEQGKEWRWINAKKFAENGGFHDNGWQPFKSQDPDINEAFAFGIQTDGTMRRGDCLLAIRDKSMGEEHRAWLRERTDLQSGIQKTKTKELRDKAREGNLTVEEIDREDEELE